MSNALIRTNRNYRLLISASAISNLGDGISMVALPWLATMLTKDPLMISAVATAQRLPWLLFALPIGVWTDYSDRRLLMLRADLVRTVLMALTVLMVLSQPQLSSAAATGGSALFTLTLIAFLFGTAEVVRDNAAQTVLPSIVAPEQLEKANGQMLSAEQVTGQFIGPPLAGLLIASSVALPFGLDSAFYAVSGLLVWLIALPIRKPSARAHFLPALLEGFTWMRRNPTILHLALMLGAINAVFVGGMTILVIYAQEVLGLSPVAYGILLSVGALGGVAGGLLAPDLAQRLGVRRSLLLALAVFFLINLMLGLCSSAVIAGLALFLEAMAGMLWNVVTVSYRQRRIPDHLLGRVNAVYRFFGWGAMSLGAIGAGATVTLLTPIAGRMDALHMPYLCAAAVCALLAVLAHLRLRFE